MRIVNKICDAELLSLEQIGRSEIYASVEKEMQTISSASMAMGMMCQSAILILFVLAYIASMSFIALGLFVVLSIIAVGFYWFRMNELKKDIHASMTLENELFDAITHLLDGFKEVKMSEMRSAELNNYIGNISAAVVDVKGNMTTKLSIINVFAQTSFYLLTAAMVFMLPRFSLTYSDTVIKIAAGVLFLAGPITNLIGSVQIYTTANVAAENIESLIAALDRHIRPASRRRARPLVFRKAPFGEIIFEHVLFEFVGTEGNVSFRLGPINLTILSGETIFITGGNGSGKSTFLRLLTCLYFPTQGVIKLDGQPLSEANAGAYRNLFSVIFYDYHLFDRLYGLPDIDSQYAEELLERLQLSDKTSLVDKRFTTLDLSSGQKRRLALLVNYLENKPICVFDEWAAEQDSDFRRYFYTNILQELKVKGKTVIVVTHDERYYDMDYIDRILKLEEGQLVPYP
jgi:putative ATP-binding cassette transporter